MNNAAIKKFPIEKGGNRPIQLQLIWKREVVNMSPRMPLTNTKNKIQHQVIDQTPTR